LFKLFAVISSFGGPANALSQLWATYRLLGFARTLKKVLTSFNQNSSNAITAGSASFLGQIVEASPTRKILGNVVLNEISPIEISVVIPCFAQAEFLFSALRSVSESTTRNHECIVVDDGNTSRRQLAMIDTLRPASKHQMLRIVKQENMGLAGARNTGIQFATGSYLKFLDADDLVLPRGIDMELDVLRQSQSNAVFSPYFYWDSLTGRSIRSMPFAMNSILISSNGSMVALDLEALVTGWEETISIPIHSATFLRSSISEFDERLKSKEDFEFWATFFKGAPRISYTKHPTAVYRGHPNQMTKTSQFRNGVYFLEVLKSISDRSGEVSADIFRDKVHYVSDVYGSEVVGYWRYLSNDRYSWLVKIEGV
jgi:glycosyltransferase involved in cell wall biosynthesis